LITALTGTERAEALADLPAWTYDSERQALHRQFTLNDFSQAFGLVMRIAFEAEKTDHHPEWSNIYNRLYIWLTTHDAGGVSARDVDMARAINNLAE
jgi:4a-hydroxytetrahydrobiopterin dehydratase